MRRSLPLAGAALLLALVTGCGSGGTDEAASDANDVDAYCSALKDAQKEFSALDNGNLGGANLDRIFDRMQSISEKAPPAVADEWRTLDGAIGQMQSGLDDLGLSFKDLSDPQKLAEVDPQKLQEFGQEMQRIGGERFQKAGDRIEKHAQEECGIKLGQQQ